VSKRQKHAGDHVCAVCGKPATCLGQYDNMTEEAYACDDCCGHGCEDGKCRPVTPAPSPGLTSEENLTRALVAHQLDRGD